MNVRHNIREDSIQLEGHLSPVPLASGSPDFIHQCRVDLLQLFNTAATRLGNNIVKQIGAERLVNNQVGLKSSESSRGTRNGVVEDGVNVCPIALKQWHRRRL